MTQGKALQGPCSHCGMPIRYAAHLVGTTAKCPGCGQMTDLVLEEPAIPDSGISKRTVVWSTVALVIVLVALVASLIALKKARQMQEDRKLRKGAVQMSVGLRQSSAAFVSHFENASFLPRLSVWRVLPIVPSIKDRLDP